jgi:hypothetical protein
MSAASAVRLPLRRASLRARFSASSSFHCAFAKGDLSAHTAL